MPFQKTVLKVAIVAFIITLIFFGITIRNSKYNTEYPPLVGSCPDYWKDINGYCINDKNLGNDSCSKKMDFTQGVWVGSNGLCLKQKWAKACGLTWDGITNHSDACDVDVNTST